MNAGKEKDVRMGAPSDAQAKRARAGGVAPDQSKGKESPQLLALFSLLFNL